MKNLAAIIEADAMCRAILASDAKKSKYIHIQKCSCGMFNHHGQEMTEEERTVHCITWTEKEESRA